MKMTNVLRGTTAAILLLAVPAKAVIVYNNPAALAGNQLGSAIQVLGMDFQVNNPGNVTSMGAFDNGLNGFGGAIAVAIYNVGTGLQVPGTLVSFPAGPGTGTLIGSSWFQAIAPVLLNPGTYSIVAQGYNNGAGGFERNYNADSGVSGTPPTFDTDGGNLTMLGHRSDQNTILNPGIFFPPGQTDLSTVDPAFGAGSFDFTAVPEAATFGFAAIGLLGLVYFGRNLLQNRQVA